ncbi:SDR family oxidoreductase [Kitasatospora acidiphila]|uniref:SDR family oxidoreductase n=1 Tax=Kitasatospora acidiphila TaxID=2567942 RepID=UPI001E35D12C|nr:NAD(P)H-binding protein [Kitasatospora acidiphila]
MRIAVAGATGNIGARTAAALERDGHEVVRISRALGVDLVTGEGLDAALVGVAAVVDAISPPVLDRDGTVAYLGAATRNLLAAGERAGVRQQVLLSIAGMDRIGGGGNAHYAGKREQERLVVAGPVPWTIVPATQFHDFAELVVSWTEHDGAALVPRCWSSRSPPTTWPPSWPSSPPAKRRAATPTSPAPTRRTWSTWPAAHWRHAGAR